LMKNEKSEEEVTKEALELANQNTRWRQKRSGNRIVIRVLR
jgi:hypothetical protein